MSTLILQDLSSSNDDGLTRVGIDRFRVLEVEEDVDLRSFVEEQHKLEYNARKFFFEFTSREEEIGDDKEIILMDKVQCNQAREQNSEFELILA